MFPEGRILDFLIVGVVALIVVGPKDLPMLMRKVGAFIAHMRGMAAEFRASFEEMARQSELDDLRREVEALRTGQPLQSAVGLGPDGGVREIFDDIHTTLREGGPPPSPVVTHQDPLTAEAPADAVAAPEPPPLAPKAEGGDLAPPVPVTPVPATPVEHIDP
jgi:sec-independent protein translocase protein TatB